VARPYCTSISAFSQPLDCNLEISKAEPIVTWALCVKMGLAGKSRRPRHLGEQDKAGCKVTQADEDVVVKCRLLRRLGIPGAA